MRGFQKKKLTSSRLKFLLAVIRSVALGFPTLSRARHFSLRFRSIVSLHWRECPRIDFDFADTSSSDISLGQQDMFLSRQDASITKRAVNRNTLFDPTNLWNTPTHDLANDFAMIGLVHKDIIVL